MFSQCSWLFSTVHSVIYRVFQSMEILSASPRGFHAFQHPVNCQPRKTPTQLGKRFLTANLENYSNKILFPQVKPMKQVMSYWKFF